VKDKSEVLEGAIRDALDAMRDESTEYDDRMFEAESILEEALEEA